MLIKLILSIGFQTAAAALVIAGFIFRDRLIDFEYRVKLFIYAKYRLYKRSKKTGFTLHSSCAELTNNRAA